MDKKKFMEVGIIIAIFTLVLVIGLIFYSQSTPEKKEIDINTTIWASCDIGCYYMLKVEYNITGYNESYKNLFIECDKMCFDNKENISRRLGTSGLSTW